MSSCTCGCLQQRLVVRHGESSGQHLRLSGWMPRARLGLLGALLAFLGAGLLPRVSVAATGCAPATVSAATITANETWTAACSPYIVTSNVTVRDGAILTIDPGVVVKFNSTRSLTIATTTLTGGLVAAGTTQNPIKFTSNQTTPTAGFWRGLVINRNVLPGSVLTNAIIEYAGVNPSLKLDNVSGVAMTLAGVEVRQCTAEGVSIVAEDPILEYLTVNCPAATKHGIVATSGSSFVVRNSTIANAISAVDAATTGGVTDTTFTSYDSGLPFSLHAERVGMVIGSNTLAGSTSASIVNVTGGTVASSATWRPFSYRITGSMNVWGASTPMLTLQPGADLRFSANSKLSISAHPSNRGGITAIGTSTLPIRFTSSAATPAPGNWAGLLLQDGILPSSRLEHVVIEYTGTGPALELERVSAAIGLQHGTIRLCNGEGISINGGTPVIDDWNVACSAGADVGVYTTNAPAFSLTNSEIFNGMEIITTTADVVVASNTFSTYNSGRPLRLHPERVVPILSANTLEGMSSSSIIEIWEGKLRSHTAWPAITYRVLGDVSVDSAVSPVLTLAAGARFRFASGKGLIIGSNSTISPGGLVAVGTQTAPIVFTSDAVTPAPGNWKGIRFFAEALDQSRLEWLRIEYTGSTTFPALEINSTDLTLEHVTIENNSKDGITIREASPIIRSSVIRNNGDDGIECSIGTTGGFRPLIVDNEISGNADRGVLCNLALDLAGNTITGSVVGVQITAVQPLLRLRNNRLNGNSSKALQNDDTGDGVDARLNWFGSAANPASQVQGDVLLNPWLGAVPVSGLLAREASLSPESFLPTSNQANVTALLSQSAQWSLTIKNSGGTTVRSFSGSGSSIAQAWNGADTGGTTVPNGTYTTELAASIGGGPTAAPVVGQLVVNDGLLVARIQDPTPLEVVPGASLSVLGTTSGPTFASYTLDYALGADPTTFTQIATGTSPISSAAVGTWNTSGLLGGVYTLRLRSFASGGGPTAEDRITVKVLQVVGPDQDDYFSPNGDLVQDTSLIRAMATVDTDWVVTVLNPQGQVTRTFQGEGALVRALWNGQTNAAAPAPDAAYTYSISVGGGIDQVSGGPTVLDTVAPQASFATPAAGSPVLTYDPVTVTGTASDLNFDEYELSYRIGDAETYAFIDSGSSVIVGGTLGQVPGHAAEDPNFTDEPLNLRLEVLDRAGNSSSAERALVPQLISITNVGSSPKYFDPYAGGSANISYTLNRPANVTIEFYRSRSWPGAVLGASILNGAARTSGGHSEIWNGSDEVTGTVPAPYAYYYSIVATDGAGRSARFNNPAAPVKQILAQLLNNLKVNGVPKSIQNFGGNPPPAGVLVDAYRNDEMHVEFSHATKDTGGDSMKIKLNDGTFIPISAGEPTPAGVIAHRYWDGRRANGTIVDIGFGLVTQDVKEVETHVVFLQHAFRLEDVRTNPYVFHPVLAGATNLKYGLPEAASVAIDIIDPNGNFLMTLQEATVKAAGVHAITWDGRNEQGEVVATEGVYTLEVRATSQVSSQTHTRRVSALVYR